MTTKANKSLTTNNIKKAVNWLARQAGVSVSHKSSLKAKLKVIANSKRVHDYTPSYSGSVKEILKNLAKHIGSTGSIYADKIIAAANKTPSASIPAKESMCLGWVCDVLQNAIGNRIFGGVGSAFKAWKTYPGKRHMASDKNGDQIPTGAIVFGYMYRQPDYDGEELGHVGICIKGYDQTGNVNSIQIRDDYWPRGVGKSSFIAWKGTYSYLGYYLVEELI